MITKVWVFIWLNREVESLIVGLDLGKGQKGPSFVDATKFSFFFFWHCGKVRALLDMCVREKMA
jgi:hypothetical protein